MALTVFGLSIHPPQKRLEGRPNYHPSGVTSKGSLCGSKTSSGLTEGMSDTFHQMIELLVAQISG